MNTWRVLFSRYKKLGFDTMTGTDEEIIARVRSLAATRSTFDELRVEAMTDQIDFYTVNKGHVRLFMILMFDN